MRQMFVICLAGIALAWPSEVSPQTVAPIAAVTGTLNDLSQQATTNLPTTDPVKQDQNTISRAAATLQNAYSTTPVVSNEYLRSLQYDQRALEYAASAPSGQADAAVSSVADDLRIKAAFSESQLSNNPSHQAPNITVNVYTRMNGRVVNDYDVGCNPRLWAAAEAFMFSFPNETSPASRTLPPGSFTIIVLKNGHRVAQKDVDVGDDGQTTVDLTIDLPSP